LKVPFGALDRDKPGLVHEDEGQVLHYLWIRRHVRIMFVREEPDIRYVIIFKYLVILLALPSLDKRAGDGYSISDYWPTVDTYIDS
jgi:hypothetical protein